MSDSLRSIVAGLPELLQLLQASDVRELELEEDGVQVRVRRAAMSLDVSGTPVDLPDAIDILEPHTMQIVAPMVGTFYRAAEPDAPPLIDTGSEVEETTVVGIIESLQVLNPVQAGCRGTVTKVRATDGHPVQYGQALFEVSPVG
jgi:acetyl/propionyl-CoA carboxylase alpha subunit